MKLSFLDDWSSDGQRNHPAYGSHIGAQAVTRRDPGHGGRHETCILYSLCPRPTIRDRALAAELVQEAPPI